MGPLNNFDPIFFYLKLGKSATSGGFDGVVTPSGDRVIKAKVTRIQPKSCRFRLWFEDEKSAIARRVIVVAGSGKPHLPAWVNQIQTQHPAERIHHSHQVDLRNLQLHGKQILYHFSKSMQQ